MSGSVERGAVDDGGSSLAQTAGAVGGGREWLERGPYTLVLGAGFFGFFAHAGVLAALDGAGTPPARVVGVSAGALAGGLHAAGLDPAALRHLLLSVRKDDFWDPGLPLGGLLKGRKFDALLRAALGDVTTVEACPTPLTVLAARPLTRRVVPLRAGPLAPAIRASCAVPLLFRPVRAAGRWLVDGGLADRSGLTAVAADERVLYHHLPRRRPVRAEPERRETATRRVLSLDLPAVSPDRLDLAPTAYETAREGAERWLDAPAPS